MKIRTACAAAALALLGAAPIAHAAPKFCATHEDSTAVHTKGDIYKTGCVVGPGNGGAFADADGDGIPNGQDDDRNGGPTQSNTP